MAGSSPGMTECGAALMRNRARNVEVGRLFEFLTALGQDFALTVKPTRKRVGEMVVVAGMLSKFVVGVRSELVQAGAADYAKGRARIERSLKGHEFRGGAGSAGCRR